MNDCGELQPDDKPSINRPAVLCGFLMPPPKLKKQLAGGLSMSEATIYTCASTLRATVKEVSLSYISRASTGNPPSLADLSVIDIKPKRYSSEKSKPLWGVENPGTLWKASEIQLLWGIISEEFENSSNLQTIRSEHLYLPGFFPDNDKPGDSLVRGSIQAPFQSYI